MEIQPQVYSTSRIVHSLASDDGALISICWKATLFDDDLVLMQLREVVLDVVSGGDRHKPVLIHQFLRANRAFADAFASVAVGEDALVGSIKSYASSKQEPPKHARQEYQVSMEGLLVVLLHMAHHRHAVLERRRAAECLHVFFEAMHVSCRQASLALESALGHARIKCDVNTHNGVCEHLTLAHVCLPMQENQSPGGWLAERMTRVFGVLGLGCEAVSAFCRHLINGAAELSRADIMTGKHVKNEGKVDLIKQSTGKRRMRVDEDWREEVAVGSVEKKRAATGRNFARAHADSVSSTVVPKYEEADLARYMVASNRTFKDKHGVFSVTEDAIRVGDPPEECLIIALWSASVERAVFLPPQVQYSLCLGGWCAD